MKRRSAYASMVVAILVALASGGCLKRTESTVTLAADGSGTVTLTTVFDRDALIALKERTTDALLRAVAEGLGGKAPPTTKTPDIKILEGMRRDGFARAKGVALVSLTYREDLERAEVLETSQVRFGDWAALHRWYDPLAVESVDSASLRREEDGSWVYERSGTVGGFQAATLLTSSFGGGPPKPGRTVSMTLTVGFPGKVLVSDAKAQVEDNRVTWRFDGETGGRGTSYQVRVRFAGAPGLRPFRVTTEDILHNMYETRGDAPADADDEDPGTGPLDGSGWIDEGELFVRGLGFVTPTYDPPEGSVPIEGRVVHRGNPVAGVLVRFALRGDDGSYSGGVVARTDESGAYSVPGLWPATYGVMIQVGRAGAWLPDIQVPEVERFRHDVVLGPHEVVVRVVDPSGGPVEGAEIWMHRGDHQAIPFGLTPETGADGTARVPFVESGPATFSATLEQANCERVTIVVPQTGPEGVITLRARGFGTVIVDVRDADGKHSPAYLCYRHPTEPVPNVCRNTSPSGRAVFHLSPGRWLVGLSTAGLVRNEEERFRQFAKEVEVQEGTTQAVVLVKPRP